MQKLWLGGMLVHTPGRCEENVHGWKHRAWPETWAWSRHGAVSRLLKHGLPLVPLPIWLSTLPADPLPVGAGA